MGENYSSGHKAQFKQMDPLIELRTWKALDDRETVTVGQLIDYYGE